jgi:tRNA U54 and U55 pseudouridine synthase Pus10
MGGSIVQWPILKRCHYENKDIFRRFISRPSGFLRTDGPLRRNPEYKHAQGGTKRPYAHRHDALSKYFENAAREMREKAKEQKQLLDHYESKSYLYGRQSQDLKSHTETMVRKYEDRAEENIKEAAAHRQIARELAQQAGENQMADISHPETSHN